MKNSKTYMDKLMKNKEFREKFDKEYCNLCIKGKNSKRIYIRRTIVFIMIPIVLVIDIDSYLLYRVGLLEYTVGLVGFLSIINGLLGTIIAFYLTGKKEHIEGD